MTYNVFGGMSSLTQHVSNFIFGPLPAVSNWKHSVFIPSVCLSVCLSVHPCVRGHTLKVCEQYIRQIARGNFTT